MSTDSAAILVLNAGSSSLKFSLFHPGPDHALELAVRGAVDALGSKPRLAVSDGAGRTLAQKALARSRARDARDAVHIATGWLHHNRRMDHVAVVGHRVVHGGEAFSAPVRVDPEVLSALERLVPLAPLHQPHNVAAIRAVWDWQPDLPQVACFDSAFHRTHSRMADVYALPHEFYEAGVRRYGFHGLSYEYIASALPRTAPEIAGGRVIVAHLGNGASLCALQGGKSVDSTMGFSALDGIPMGTRPGAVDPGVLLYLIREYGLGVSELEDLLYRRSGLLGLSGVSNDMRLLLASSDPRARQKVDYWVWRLAREIGALAAVLGGLDGLVFTAGIGENQAGLRARVVQSCAWLGLELDPAANATHGPRISTASSRASAWVIPTNEELMIARHTCACWTRSLPPRAEPTPA